MGRKKVYKLSLFADDITACEENLGGKKSTKILLKQVNDCIKVAGYKVNVQKSTLYTINEQVEFEIKNITNHISTPKMK